MYSNSIEFDCLSESNEILFLRTPACKCVFFNGQTIILQLIKNGNLYLKFLSFIKKLEQIQNVSESLIKENENQVLSMVLHIDTDAFVWFERERPGRHSLARCLRAPGRRMVFTAGHNLE